MTENPVFPGSAPGRIRDVHVAYLHYLYGRDTALNHVRQFAEAARSFGHRVDVHAMNLAPPPPAAGGGEIGVAGRLRQAVKRRFGRYLHDPKELLWNPRYVRKELALLGAEPPDVLLVRNHDLGVSCVPVARRLGLPLVLEVNAPAEEARRYYDEYCHMGWLQEWCSRFKLRRVDAVVVVSQALADYLVERYQVDPERITVAPNGADLERFRPDTPAEMTADPDAPRVGFVASFQQFHGLDLLAGMVEAVAAARPEVCFLFVGGGDGAEAFSRRLDLGERVTFTGRVPHGRVPGLVASFDVGVIADAAPYQCPLKLIEWMAAGKAIAAPRHGPIEDLVADGVHALLFEPRDQDRLVARVLELIDDPARRRELGSAAARRAHESLSWEDNAQRVLAACEQARRRGGSD